MSATTDKAEEKENKARMERKVLVDDALFLEKRSLKSLEMSCDHNGRFFKNDLCYWYVRFRAMPTTTTTLLIGMTVSTAATATATATTGQQRPESSSFSQPPCIAPGTCQRGRDTATTSLRTRSLSRMMKRRTRRKRRTSQVLVEEDEETGGGAERRDAPS